MQEDNADKLGTDKFEVSWHGTARPEHQEWQGKVYTKEQLASVCGLGSVTGLLGANCRHTYFPFIEGVSERIYTDEQLRAMNERENEPKYYNGKPYTLYEATQRQRYLETSMRAQRQKIKLLEEAGADEQDITLVKCKYRRLSQEYTAFSKQMGLPQERDRIYADGLGKIDVKIKDVSIVKNQLADPPVIIAGVDCTVTKGTFGFHDGRGGIKKAINAVIYETPDGTQFIFPEKYVKAQQQMTPEQAIRCWYQVPDEIRSKAQKTIEFVDYYNPADSYWRKKYKNFPHSYATGGDKITFYRYDHPHQDDYVVRTYCHEASHLIDTAISTQGNRFSEENLWTNAMKSDIIISGKKSPTTYGENSCAEDFAESVAEFVKDETGFTSQFPNRAKIIKSIIKKVI